MTQRFIDPLLRAKRFVGHVMLQRSQSLGLWLGTAGVSPLHTSLNALERPLKKQGWKPWPEVPKISGVGFRFIGLPLQPKEGSLKKDTAIRVLLVNSQFPK